MTAPAVGLPQASVSLSSPPGVCGGKAAGATTWPAQGHRASRRRLQPATSLGPGPPRPQPRRARAVLGVGSSRSARWAPCGAALLLPASRPAPALPAPLLLFLGPAWWREAAAARPGAEEEPGGVPRPGRARASPLPAAGFPARPLLRVAARQGRSPGRRVFPLPAVTTRQRPRSHASTPPRVPVRFLSPAPAHPPTDQVFPSPPSL